MIPPRAADDFAIIRARLEELRRERARAAPETGDRSESGPRPIIVLGTARRSMKVIALHARFTKSYSDKASSAHKSPKHLRPCAT